MIVSRITSDALAAFPAEVVAALGLKPGDELAFEVGFDGVLMTRTDATGTFGGEAEDDDDYGKVDLEHDAEVQTAIDEILSDPSPRPTFPADEVFARVFAHIDSLRDGSSSRDRPSSRDRDAA